MIKLAHKTIDNEDLKVLIKFLKIKNILIKQKLQENLKIIFQKRLKLKTLYL